MTRRTYYGEDINVTFDADLCQHSGRCVSGLPQVFEVGRRPWVLPDAADADRVAQVVSSCPSGALLYERKHQADSQAQ
ncbi:MAG: (4Fe-4S)-binding protein [Propionibacteriaceae bacterium]|jgi:uncharacterized Fe-S cluster protein YjdI|nr:(4Fe-4S)-binding protein [Propionibacteriaceae bacterium]